MRFNPGILLSFLLALLPPNAATAQKQLLGENSSGHLPDTSLALSRTEVLDAIKAEAGSIRIQNEISIRDNIQSEVDRYFGRTIGLIQLLLAVLTALPIFASISLLLLRNSIIENLAKEAERQITSKLDEEVKAALDQFNSMMQSEMSTLLVENSDKMAASRAELEERTTLFMKQLSERYASANVAADGAIIQDLDAVESLYPENTAIGQAETSSLLNYKHLYEIGDYASAILATDRAIEQNQDSLSALTYKGLALMKLDRLEEAILTFDKVTVLNKDSVAIWQLKGRLLMKQTRLEEAVSAFDRVTDLRPEYIDAWINKARALAKLERLEDALSAYEKAIEIDDYCYQAWIGKASALGQLKRFKELNHAYAKAQELAPKKNS